MQTDVRAEPAMIILPCPTCGRAVKVLGRVVRVLCACGQVLMETARKTSPLNADSNAEVRRAG